MPSDDKGIETCCHEFASGLKLTAVCGLPPEMALTCRSCPPLAGKMVSGVERVDSSSTIAQFFEKELRADPAFANVRVEVLNAAVNFNKIPEVASGYLTEYAVWNPDIVIVFGSGNNFPAHARVGEVADRQYGLQKPHPWRLEFERVANERTFFSLVEHVVTHAEAQFASVAWSKKAGAAIVDKLFSISDERAQSSSKTFSKYSAIS